MSENQEFEVKWELGTAEVATISVVFAVILGLPFLLSRPEFLVLPSVIFYIFLYVIGFFGHIDDVTAEAYEKVKMEKIWVAVGLGLIGFLIIQIMFFLGMTLLATSEGMLTMSKGELLLFNLTFVIGAEELVFRDTLPFILSSAFGRVTDENLSIALAFVISSVAFGTLHIFTYGFDLIAVVKAIIAGIVLSIIRIFGGLFASYIAHMTYNGLNIMGLFALII